MDASNVISMMGAIALFLFGMSTMSNGLEKLSSGKLERILEKLTDNIFKGVLLGAVITGLVQSSGATTVMCVGFVNAGIMKLRQTVGIIMGANIGTTVTAQILRLSSISTDNALLSMLNPNFLGPVLALVGVIFYMFITGGKKKNVGQILVGLGILFIGMNSMTESVSGLKDLPEFQKVFTSFSNPLLGVLVGAAVTTLLQSSSASMGILQALSTTGIVTFHTAIPLIMGQNIGSTVTALLSSIGASINAKRTAMIHVFFNLIGSLFFLVLLYAVNAVFPLPFWTATMDMGSIANLHLLFNVACTALLLPFNKQLVVLVERLVPGDADAKDVTFLDERLLANPSIALDCAHDAAVQMGRFALTNFRRSVDLLEKFDAKKLERMSETETALDKMQDSLDNYLVKLTNRALTPEENAQVSELLHTLTDFERIGDYAMNLGECAIALDSKGLEFSPIAKKELKCLTDAVEDAIAKALKCYEERSYEDATQVEPIEEVVDLLREDLRARHIARLKAETCTVELGTQFLELLINLERISDHCSNVAIHILQETAAKNDLVRFDAHAYTQSLHLGKDPQFEERFAAAKLKYYDSLMKAEPPIGEE